MPGDFTYEAVLSAVQFWPLHQRVALAHAIIDSLHDLQSPPEVIKPQAPAAVARPVAAEKPQAASPTIQVAAPAPKLAPGTHWIDETSTRR